VAYVTTCVN